MKKRRKTLSLLLAVSLALGSFGSAPSWSASLGNVQAAEPEKDASPILETCGAEGDNITWELVEDPDGAVFPEQGPDSQPLCYELILTGTGELSGSKPWELSSTLKISPSTTLKIINNTAMEEKTGTNSKLNRNIISMISGMIMTNFATIRWDRLCFSSPPCFLIWTLLRIIYTISTNKKPSKKPYRTL